MTGFPGIEEGLFCRPLMYEPHFVKNPHIVRIPVIIFLKRGGQGQALGLKGFGGFLVLGRYLSLGVRHLE